MSLDKIKQYCRRLEKHSDDKLVLKETLHKLNKIELTVDLLQQTGVGKVVSCIKKRGDSAGVMAADLIRKWRKVVDRETEMEESLPSASVDEAAGGDTVKHKPSHHDDAKASRSSSQGGKSLTSSSSHQHRSSSSGSSKPASDKVSGVESGLFSDAAMPIKVEVKQEPSDRHSRESHRSDSKDHRKQKEEKSNSYGHKGEQKSHREKQHRGSSKHADSTASHKVKKIKQEQEMPLDAAPEVKSERRSDTHHDERKISSKTLAPVGANNSSLPSKDKDRAAKDSKDKKDQESESRRDRKRKATDEPDEVKGEDGMNAENFGSFEECLGSVEPKRQKKRKKLSSANPAAPSPKMTVTSSTLNGSINKPKGPRLPDLLDKKPADIMENSSLVIPQLVTCYKPLPRVEPKSGGPILPSSSSSSAANSGGTGGARAPSTMTNEEAVMFTTSRKDRTAVYSGRKQTTLTSVPTLYDACIRVLTDNIDLLEETGGVPFEILRPIMERCTWQQLYNLEYYNPYLLEDSDPLWEIHARRDFRGKQPAKGEETWRELYLRCHDEREQKLKSLTASISQSMKARSAPVRTTKLAYVDSAAKPPRNVQRAQLKHGTHITPSHAKTSQPSQARSIAAQASTSAATESVRAPPATASAASRKAKPAPLMAKTLSFFKMRRATGYGFASR